MAQEGQNNFREVSPQNAELFHLIIENIKDYAIFMIDVEGRVVSWNPGVEWLLGYAEGEIINRSIAIIFTPEDQELGAHFKEMETALVQGRSEDKRWHLRKDGSRFWANGMIMPLKNADGTLRGFAKVMRDDTAQKLAEENLEQVLSSITDSFYRFDRDLRYTYVNRATTEMFGIAKEKFLQKTLWELFPDAAGNKFHREVLRAFKEQEKIVFENYYEPFDRWFENRVYPSADGLSVFTSEITERKRAEETLRASEEKYRTLFDSIDSGLSVIQLLFDENDQPLDYRFLEINPAFEKQTGLVNAVGKTVRELIPNLEERWFKIYGKVALTGESVRFEDFAAALNSWYDVYAFRIGEARERKVAIIFKEITNSKNATLALIERERLAKLSAAVNHTLIENKPLSEILHSCAEAIVRNLNAAFARIWMLNKSENVLELQASAGMYTHLDGAHARIRVGEYKIGQIAAERKPHLTNEVINDERVSDREWAQREAITSFAGYPLIVEERLVGVVAMFSRQKLSAATLEAIATVADTIALGIERKRAEYELTQSLKQLETERLRLSYLFEQAPAFVATLRGSSHIFELTNLAFGQLIGHRDVIEKPAREALPELIGQGFFELLDTVFQTGEPFTGRELPIEIQREPASELEKRFVNFVYQPIFDADQKVSGIFVHGVDITEQVEARQRAESANSLKDEFLATISHELRTPLNSILGWSQMLQTNNLGDREKEKALATIERNALAQNQLIDDLLDVSRIITGKLRLDVRVIDLANIIMAAIEAVRPAADAKNIRLQTLLDPQAGLISGDPDRLQQVVWNLLSNAIKFTPRDGRVQLRLERVNSHLEIVVSDTGKGIEPEFIPHVFDRFRQSDGSMTRRHGGLGLGLAIVQQLVELHGGTVSVSSGGSGQGAMFTVSLPLPPVRKETVTNDLLLSPLAQPAGAAHTAAATNAPDDCPPELSNLQILLVDDEADSRELLNFLLVSRGAQVVLASSAATAFEAIQLVKFDVVISDIGMPEEDGFSLIGRIRNLPNDKGGNVPAIALTAYARSEDRARALNLGFQMHLAKPVDSSELIVAVAKLAERVRNSQQI